jgi:hypothetical protein
VPPYRAVVSASQRRALFAKARRGEIAMSEAEGKAHAAKGKHLPERVKKRKRGRKGRR